MSPVGGLTADSRLFITAKLTPCSRDSDSALLWQKNAYSFTQSVPFSASLVYHSIAIVMFIPESCVLIMSVFLESTM